MWFGIHPVGGWIAFAVIRWGGRIDEVGNVAVKWITGKVACSSCDTFHSMKTGFCATCGRALPKPLCPRCKEDKTQLVNVRGTGSFISPWISLLLGCAVFALIVVAEGPGVDVMYGIEELGPALVAAIICVYAVIFVVKRFSLRAKRIKCLSCDRESPVTDVVAFQQPPAIDKGADIQLGGQTQYASFWQRMAASTIDLLLFCTPPILITLPFASPDGHIAQPIGMVLGFFYIAWAFVAPLVIFALPLRLWGGQTLGKKLLGIVVVDQNGRSLSWAQSLLRPILYFASYFPMLLGFFGCIWDSQKRCFHDMIVHTLADHTCRAKGRLTPHLMLYFGG